jgi:mono/diheme cytochrome c family protein
MRVFVIAVALAILALPIVALSAFGQCRTAYAPQYYQPTYQQSYANYQIVQPVAVATFLVPNTYYSVQPDLAAARIQQQIADDAAERALGKMLQLLKQQQPVPGAIPPAAGQGALAAPHDHATSLATKVQAVVAAHCIACHGAGNKNGIDLTDVSRLDDRQAMAVHLRTSLDPVDPGYMPKNKAGEKTPALGQQEYDDITHWAFEVASKFRKAAPLAKPAVPDKAVDPKPPIPPAVDPKKPGDDDNEVAKRKKKGRPIG